MDETRETPETPAPPEARGVISVDKYDALAFRASATSAPELAALARRGRDEHALARDVWASLYKPAPVLRDGARETHAPLIREMQGTSETSALRARTVLDEGASAFAAGRLATTLAGRLPQLQAARALARAQARKRAHARGCVDLDAPEVKADGEAEADASARAIGRAAVRDVTRELDDALALAGAGAGDDEPAPRPDASTLLRLAGSLSRSPALVRIAALAGRLKLAARARKLTREARIPEEVVDVELGNELTRLLPSEMLAISHPVLKREAMLRFAEKRLMQYRLEGRAPQASGPIILMLDASGSMAGERQEWASALALALLSVARREKRAFALWTWHDYARRVLAVEVSATVEPVALLNAVNYCPTGGTCLSRALDAALSDVKPSGKLARADVVVVTDGEPDYQDASRREEWRADWRKRAEKAGGVRLLGIQVGTRGGPLPLMCDGLATIEDLSADAAALDVAFSV